jgi:oligoendopeptidase F
MASAYRLKSRFRCCRTPTAKSARRPAWRWPTHSRQNLRTFTLITNTLAKDKEISDRWRGFEDIADSRHLANRVERPVVDALAQAVREACPTAIPPLLCNEGPLARA